MTRSLHRFLGLGLLLAAVPGAGGAAEFTLAGSPARVMGFVNQGAAYGLGGDHFDNQEGFNSAVFDALVEAEYNPAYSLSVFGALQLTGDWAYELLSGNDDWTDRRFQDSRSELFLDTQLRDVLQEFHATWVPGSFYIRAGKQIVVWGETDGFRIMDQINPFDQRRGLGDVEFESTILPIWILKADYYLHPESAWLQDASVEFVFNPNADFVPNRRIVPGNDVAGVWAPTIDTPLPFPPFTARIGSFAEALEQPDEWDPEGYELGVRMRAVVQDKIVTLNYFNGIDNDPVRVLSGPPGVELAFDGVPILHLPVTGKYHRFRTAGATFTGDFPGLSSSLLGGVAPVLRLEGFYGFNNTFATQGFVKAVEQDEVRYAVGVDWKIKVSFLNPRAYFFLSPQFYHQKILDYPTDVTLSDAAGRLEDDNY
ncbi:MAG: DUF1302 family protein, partial [Deferrisomatales bacterium]